MIENYVSILKASREMHISQNKVREQIVEKYGHNIKTACVVCGNKIKYSIKRFYSSGNVCPKCSGKAEHIMKARKLHKEILTNQGLAEQSYNELKALLKKYSIREEDLFLSINVYRSFQHYIAKSKKSRPSLSGV